MKSDFTIQAQTGEKIIGCTYLIPHAKGLAFIAHGLAGYKEEAYLQKVRSILEEHQITVVMYDARYSFGESDGPLEKACFSNFITDLNSVINWAQNQSFYQEPFMLVGHSLGAGACLQYAIHHPEKIQSVVSLSAVYNGQLLLDSYTKNKPDFVKKWQEEKRLFKQREDNQKSGYISYNHIIDALSYKLEEQASRITCPTLIVCGNHDISSTLEINQCLFNHLNCFKELVVIQECGHTYKTNQNLQTLQESISSFLSTLEIGKMTFCLKED